MVVQVKYKLVWAFASVIMPKTQTIFATTNAEQKLRKFPLQQMAKFKYMIHQQGPLQLHHRKQ